MRRPRSARAARARSTASRMSLTPAMTAESCMNSGVGAARDEPRERGLAGARRAPEDQRMELTCFERLAQRLARRRAPAPGRRIHRACAAACGRPAAAAHRRVRTSRRKSGCPPGLPAPRELIARPAALTTMRRAPASARARGAPARSPSAAPAEFASTSRGSPSRPACM